MQKVTPEKDINTSMNTMSKTKVSIIIPAYKQEKYLRQCLDSVIKQSLKDIEIIIIDEGDLDITREIIDEYELKEPRIKTIHEKNGGYGASMNKGIAAATGEYIGIVEADDFVDSKMFENLYNLAQSNEADLAKSDFYLYTTSNNQARKACRIAKSKENKVLNIKEDTTLLRIQPSIWSAIYKQEFLKKNDIKFLETAGGSYQDTSFTFKTFCLAEKIVLTSKAYLYYRTDNDASSVKSKGKIYAICDEYNEITNFLNSHPDLKQHVNSEKLLEQYNAYIWNLVRIDENFREDFIEKFSQDFAKYDKLGELNSTFYKNIDKKAVNMLIYDKKSFAKYLEKIIANKKKRAKRNKKFSIRINSSRIDIILFGKQVLTKEF